MCGGVCEGPPSEEAAIMKCFYLRTMMFYAYKQQSPFEGEYGNLASCYYSFSLKCNVNGLLHLITILKTCEP